LDVTAVVAISTFAILFNYGLANAAALKLEAGSRAYPRAVPIAGLLLCLLLMLFVQVRSFAAGMFCLLIGVLGYLAGKK
jgi:APA family basic amino acid/polyamine antiporter